MEWGSGFLWTPLKFHLLSHFLTRYYKMNIETLEQKQKEEVKEVKPKGKAPDYKGDGVAVWIEKDKNGKAYLSIKILNGMHVNAFKNEPRK